MTSQIIINDNYKNLFKSVVNENMLNNCPQCQCQDNDNWNVMQSLMVADNNDEKIKAKIYDKYLRSKLCIDDSIIVENYNFELNDNTIIFSSRGGIHTLKVLDYEKLNLSISSNSDKILSIVVKDDYIIITADLNNTNEDINNIVLTVTNGTLLNSVTKEVFVSILADKQIEIE